MSGALDQLTVAPTLTEFRDEMPAFADSAKYTDAMIAPYLALASVAVNARRWGQFYRTGIKLMIAHYLALDAAQAAGRGSGLGGFGILSSKSVGPASVSYDTQSGTELNAGHWNLTLYGRRYISLVRLVGMGGVQIGYPGMPASSPGTVL
jgi:hypothetical protein